MSDHAYQAVDGPLAQEPLVFTDDHFDNYNGHIEIRITDTGRIAIYRRRPRPFSYGTFATIGGNPHGTEDEVAWGTSYDNSIRALVFVGYKGY